MANFSVLTLSMSLRYFGNELYNRFPNTVIAFSWRDCAGFLFVGYWIMHCVPCLRCFLVFIVCPIVPSIFQQITYWDDYGRCTIFYFKCSGQLHKIYYFIFKCPGPKQKLYCFFLYNYWPRGPFSPVRIPVPCPKENHMVLFSVFI